ncbi:hypothetical protein MPTK1_2g23070 [Marchantia polymorpha subsp. ruderalis]|uniref:Uncharacterized protein n=1 Tax=Marchantia polymorpha TaxID=3197 RepID=A0A2R6WN34_MARPO|nr:hypothetical protein MARPO_0072s0024 [Marchantia polymorpha]BBN03384.1 hypothetical protein Mp_2g23070 [Marchantia polymorpha subsp. ruderalis]|eukprot:PTQ35267.1 hypothetical protein MARPO_0072s0024 [Marchantia polymorpha]
MYARMLFWPRERGLRSFQWSKQSPVSMMMMILLLMMMEELKKSEIEPIASDVTKAPSRRRRSRLTRVSQRDRSAHACLPLSLSLSLSPSPFVRPCVEIPKAGTLSAGLGSPRRGRENLPDMENSAISRKKGSKQSIASERIREGSERQAEASMPGTSGPGLGWSVDPDQSRTL